MSLSSFTQAMTGPFGEHLRGGGAAQLFGLGGGRGFGLVILGIVAFEIVWRLWIARRGYDGLAAATTLGVAIGHAITEGLSRIVIVGVYFWVWSVTPLHLPLGDWRTWAVGFLAVEFFYYWFHRWSHEIRWLWASHSVHHSATELTLPSALRLPWTHLISGGWLIYIPLVALGFHPVLVLVILAVDLFYQFFLHTEAVPKLGPIEWVMNTPSHHRVHHGVNDIYIDKNYGGMVIFYDRLFGTFQAEMKDEKNSLWSSARHEFEEPPRRRVRGMGLPCA